MALQARDQRTINGLTRRHVEQTLSGLKPFLSASRWVSTTNRYSTDTVIKLENEIAGGGVPNRRDLSQYIAASCLLHSADGWSYLGKALVALLRGDPHRARHLAYYAELRAATSLLATEGIGIFSQFHFALTAPNVATKLHTLHGTHQFAWECLEYWSGRPASGNLFARMIRPYGISLEDWFASTGGVAAVTPQAQAWFRQWGVDLRSLPRDRHARNISSYQPDGIPDAWYVDGRDTLEFARDLWSSLEPSPLSRFEAIDRNILRIGIEKLFMARTARAPVAYPHEFERFAEGIVKVQSLSPDAEGQWLRFITRKTSPHDAIIFSRAHQLATAPDVGSEAVISRAALLLRVASGSTTMLLQAAGYNAASIAFWADGLGRGRGLWEGNWLGDPLDLWADVAPLLEDIEAFQQKYSAGQQSFFRMGTELGQTLTALGACERVAIWSMTP
jgi:hypothetical protein